MSRRETTLCDVEISNYGGSVTCPRVAVIVCVLCKRDICTAHLLHHNGGLLVHADSIVPGAVNSNNQDMIYVSNSSQTQQTYPQVNMQMPMFRLQVCVGCRHALNDRDIDSALDGIKDQFIKQLAASIAAKALETK